MSAMRCRGPQGLRVLVVEDHVLSRQLFGQWLEAAGHEVHTVVSADGALEFLISATYDVAIIDVELPGHDGLWLARQIRQYWPGVQVIFATAREQLDPQDTLVPGVLGYLLKPFEASDLLGLISAAVPPPSTPSPGTRTLRVVGGRDGMVH